jgi:hypothetical protein
MEIMNTVNLSAHVSVMLMIFIDMHGCLSADDSCAVVKCDVFITLRWGGYLNCGVNFIGHDLFHSVIAEPVGKTELL